MCGAAQEVARAAQCSAFDCSLGTGHVSHPMGEAKALADRVGPVWHTRTLHTQTHPLFYSIVSKGEGGDFFACKCAWFLLGGGRCDRGCAGSAFAVLLDAQPVGYSSWKLGGTTRAAVFRLVHQCFWLYCHCAYAHARSPGPL